MPELPEVETVRRGLHEMIVGRTIKSAAAIDSPKSFPNNPDDVTTFLIGATVTAVRRRAKVLMIDLSSDYTLVIHLKMTGQLVFVKDELGRHPSADTIAPPNDTRFGAGHPNDSLIGKLPDRSTRVIFEFKDGSHLYFNDQRKFG